MEPRKRRMSFTAALASALSEWLLIFMLLVYGIFGYIITKFARYCDLPIPCLLCSRIDHIVGGVKVGGVYRDLICKDHKLEISSLVFCNFHGKLVDVCGMCESCLFSFATKDKSNAETYRLLVGKLGTQYIGGFEEDSLPDDNKPTSSNMKHCTCCNELWISRSNTQMYLQTRSTGFDASDFELPLSREFCLDREIEKTAQFLAERTQIEGKTGEESPVHFGYSELKITSDSESEIQVSDNEDNGAVISNDPLRDLILDSTPTAPFITMSGDDSFPDKMNDMVVLSMESSQILGQVQSNVDEPQMGPSVASTLPVRHDLEDSELKITSDSESEIRISDNEDSGAFISNDLSRDFVLDSTRMDPFITMSEDDSFSDKMNDMVVLSMQSSQILGQVQSDVNEPHVVPSVASSLSVRHELEDSELKITSDSESESRVSDNEDSGASISNDPLRDLVLDSTLMNPFITMPEDDSFSDKMNDIVVLSMESSQILLGQVQSDVDELHMGPSVASTLSVRHEFEELNSQEINQNIDTSGSTIPAKIHDIESSDIGNVSVTVSENGSDIQEAAIAQVQETDKTRELEISKITTDINCSKMSSDENEGGMQLQIPSLDLVDAYKLVISSKGRQMATKLSEQLAGNYSPRFNEDLKLLLSQFSRGMESPGFEIMSPGISRNLDELKTYDSSTSIGMKLLQKRLSLERNDSRTSLDRNESGFESVDFNTVSEVEGESEIDRLKRQLEYDRKFMTALLKELEEERNASAISANEAMAMITRLQEEKAALQMEASQGIRIMEDQAEYDMKALDKLNELVVEKDTEIQDLEAELEYFRTKYPNKSFSENEEEMDSSVGRFDKIMSDSDLSNVDRFGYGVNLGDLEANGERHSKHSVLEIEDEKEYISRCLRNLEKKLNLLSSNGKHRDSISVDQLEKQEGGSKLHEGDDQINEVDDDKNVLSQIDDSVSKVSLHKETDIVAIGYELCNLSERLQAIEADKSFIESAINTLKNGEEGIIHEIASHLRELRRIGIRRFQALPKD